MPHHLPHPPTNLVGSLVADPFSIHLAWDSAGDETQFNVYRQTDGGAPTLFTVPATGAGSFSYDDSAIASSHAYAYRVNAENASGEGDGSNTVTVTT